MVLFTVHTDTDTDDDTDNDNVVLGSKLSKRSDCSAWTKMHCRTGVFCGFCRAFFGRAFFGLSILPKPHCTAKSALQNRICSAVHLAVCGTFVVFCPFFASKFSSAGTLNIILGDLSKCLRKQSKFKCGQRYYKNTPDASRQALSACLTNCCVF